MAWLEDLFSVFPTQVGVIPIDFYHSTRLQSVPHASGGDPKYSAAVVSTEKCSPRKWG